MAAAGDSESKSRLEKVASLWHGYSSRDGFTVVAERLQAVRNVVQEEIAAQLVDVLNREIETRPMATIAEKQEICKWANGELRKLGLAVQCPKTGLPGMLHTAQGHTPIQGRFQIQLLGPESGRKRTHTSEQIWSLKLMTAPLRVEPFAARQIPGKSDALEL